MRIAVLCCYPFPDGLAATTRIKTYFKGLAELGVRTSVFVCNPTDSRHASNVLPDRGITGEGIEYCYPSGRRFGRHKLQRVLGMLLLNKLRACRAIYRASREERIDYLLIANDYLPLLYLFVPFCRLLGIRPVFITDEYPEPIRSKLARRIPRWKKRAYDFILKYVSAAVFMTEKLDRYYNPDGKIRSFILPTITDTSRFDSATPYRSERKYLCYMGNMELAKDNVDNIIVAFSRIADHYPDIDLHLYGAPSAADRRKLEALISELGLLDRVFLKGRAEYDEVPGILHGAYLLVSSQPDSKRAEGGFPTKLGEYLATGRPVLLTDVGEISRYVRDGVHVYIVRPEDPEAYALKLCQILDDYASAQAVGKTGQTYLHETFDYRIICKNLLNFLNRLHREN